VIFFFFSFLFIIIIIFYFFLFSTFCTVNGYGTEHFLLFIIIETWIGGCILFYAVDAFSVT
jgi:hypothetical protein